MLFCDEEKGNSTTIYKSLIYNSAALKWTYLASSNRIIVMRLRPGRNTIFSLPPEGESLASASLSMIPAWTVACPHTTLLVLVRCRDIAGCGMIVSSRTPEASSLSQALGKLRLKPQFEERTKFLHTYATRYSLNRQVWYNEKVQSMKHYLCNRALFYRYCVLFSIDAFIVVAFKLPKAACTSEPRSWKLPHSRATMVG